MSLHSCFPCACLMPLPLLLLPAADDEYRMQALLAQTSSCSMTSAAHAHGSPCTSTHCGSDSSSTAHRDSLTKEVSGGLVSGCAAAAKENPVC
jgi:hypothetical protein